MNVLKRGFTDSDRFYFEDPSKIFILIGEISEDEEILILWSHFEISSFNTINLRDFFDFAGINVIKSYMHSSIGPMKFVIRSLNIDFLYEVYWCWLKSKFAIPDLPQLEEIFKLSDEIRQSKIINLVDKHTGMIKRLKFDDSAIVYTIETSAIYFNPLSHLISAIHELDLSEKTKFFVIGDTISIKVQPIVNLLSFIFDDDVNTLIDTLDENPSCYLNLDKLKLKNVTIGKPQHEWVPIPSYFKRKRKRMELLPDIDEI